MATKRVSALEEEKMTDANIRRVIALLNPADKEVKPITKKDACSLLGMAYNTKRLDQVLAEFVAKCEQDKARRASKRGKPPSIDEIIYAIEEYITGEPIDAISKALYRSPLFIRSILDKYHVPIRSAASDYFKPPLIPEGAVRDTFAMGEVVYSARYDSIARVEGDFGPHQCGRVYRIWLLSDKWKQFAYQPASELASLQHLRELGVRV